MPGNSFGRALVLSSFGESHGPAVGGVLDGYPSGLPVDIPFICSEIDRRRPGAGPEATTRREPDEVEFVSGVFDGRSTGAPIAFLVRNTYQRSSDYDHLEHTFRPSHADYTWEKKFGIRDHRGGGRSSARETVVRVVAGALVKTWLKPFGIAVTGRIASIGPFDVPPGMTGLPDVVTGWLEELRAEGDTAGGVVECAITGVPAGLGEPVFDRLQASLAAAMLSINAVKGFEYGSGFRGTLMRGSEHNDLFVSEEGRIRTLTNHSGGIQGGISNGEDILFRVAFKPVATLMKDQPSVDRQGRPVTIPGKGRHDVCVVPRAVVVVEAMAALVLGDHLARAGSCWERQ